MAFDQGGVRGITTKAALKAAAKAGTPIPLYSTSMFGGFSGDAGSLPSGLTFNVVGPDPYNKRSWYASVLLRDGKIIVK